MATFVPSTSLDLRTGKLQWQARFTSLPHALLTHPTYSELSGRGTKLLLAMASAYVGNNNGHLTATFSRMKAFGFRSKVSLTRAIRELITFGYIIRTRTQVLRSPALYAITWLPINKAPAGRPYDSGITPGDEATDTWRHIDPVRAKSAARARAVTAVHAAEAMY